MSHKLSLMTIKIALMMRILILIPFLMVLLSSLPNQMILNHVLASWMVIVFLLMILLIHIILNKNKKSLAMLYTLSTFVKYRG